MYELFIGNQKKILEHELKNYSNLKYFKQFYTELTINLIYNKMIKHKTDVSIIPQEI